MTINSPEELAAMRTIGRIVAQTLRAMGRYAREGMTTRELDAYGQQLLSSQGARSAPALAYGFPGATCISLNDEAAHGIPGDRVIRAGDLINIDVSAELAGYFADTAATFQIGRVSDQARRLCRCTRRALAEAIWSARAGRPFNHIGRAVERQARACGFRIIRNLAGHGVGRHIHEAPGSVLNYYEPADRRRLPRGLVLTIEPFLSARAQHTVSAADGWTLRTPDGSLTAQYEHTVVITNGRPILLTV